MTEKKPSKKVLFTRRKKDREKRNIIGRMQSLINKYIATRQLTPSEESTLKEFYKKDHGYIFGGKEFKGYPSKEEMLFMTFRFILSSPKIKKLGLYSITFPNTDKYDLQTAIYCFIFDIDPRCCNGKYKKIVDSNFHKGLGFCSLTKECKCSTKNKSDGMLNMTPEQKENKKLKSIETSRITYGCDYPSQSPDVKAKIADTCEERYNSPSFLWSDAYRAQQDEALKDKDYTIYARSPAANTKRKNTNKERCGSENPFGCKEILEKARQTHFENTGRYYPNQSKISLESLDILNDKDKLLKLLDSMPIQEVADKLGVVIGTIYGRMKKFGIEAKDMTSHAENCIADFISNLGIEIVRNSRQIIKPREIDIFLPKFNIAIEYNGLYWHSEKNVENDYHLKKYYACSEKGIRLISINEDEYDKNPQLIHSKLLNILHLSEKGLPARKLQIRTITSSESNKFCNQYHIQGEPISELIYAIGAFDGDTLIGIMSFSEINSEIEMVRFCHDGLIHNGLFSKMLKHSINENDWDNIVAYADLRYSEGNVYEVNGFNAVDILEPDYRYVYACKSFDKSISNESGEYIIRGKIIKDVHIFKMFDIGKIKYVLDI